MCSSVFEVSKYPFDSGPVDWPWVLRELREFVHGECDVWSSTNCKVH